MLLCSPDYLPLPEEKKPFLKTPLFRPSSFDFGLETFFSFKVFLGELAALAFPGNCDSRFGAIISNPVLRSTQARPLWENLQENWGTSWEMRNFFRSNSELFEAKQNLFSSWTRQRSFKNYRSRWNFFLSSVKLLRRQVFRSQDICKLTQQPRIWFLTFSKIYFHVAEIYRRCWLEERGQRLENVVQTHLVLASGNLVLQKTLALPKPSRGCTMTFLAYLEEPLIK